MKIRIGLGSATSGHPSHAPYFAFHSYIPQNPKTLNRNPELKLPRRACPGVFQVMELLLVSACAFLRGVAAAFPQTCDPPKSSFGSLVCGVTLLGHRAQVSKPLEELCSGLAAGKRSRLQDLRRVHVWSSRPDFGRGLNSMSSKSGICFLQVCKLKTSFFAGHACV